MPLHNTHNACDRARSIHKAHSEQRRDKKNGLVAERPRRAPRRVVKKLNRRNTITIPASDLSGTGEGMTYHGNTMNIYQEIDIYTDQHQIKYPVVRGSGRRLGFNQHSQYQRIESQLESRDCRHARHDVLHPPSQFGHIGRAVRGCNGIIWGKVTADEGNCYRLSTHRIAKKCTRGRLWEFTNVAATKTTAKFRRKIQG